MIIGKFQPRVYQSFASTTGGCVKDGSGYKWTGEAGPGWYGTGKGSTCQAARADFCNTYGTTCSNGKKGCYGDPGCPSHDSVPATIATNTAKGTAYHPNPNYVDTKTYPPSGTGASDKCGGCDAGNIGCELGKLSCEASNWFNDAAGNFGKGFFDDPKKLLMIGGGALVLILLLKRR